MPRLFLVFSADEWHDYGLWSLKYCCDPMMGNETVFVPAELETALVTAIQIGDTRFVVNSKVIGIAGVGHEKLILFAEADTILILGKEPTTMPDFAAKIIIDGALVRRRKRAAKNHDLRNVSVHARS